MPRNTITTVRSIILGSSMFTLCHCSKGFEPTNEPSIPPTMFTNDPSLAPTLAPTLDTILFYRTVADIAVKEQTGDPSLAPTLGAGEEPEAVTASGDMLIDSDLLQLLLLAAFVLCSVLCCVNLTWRAVQWKQARSTSNQVQENIQGVMSVEAVSDASPMDTETDNFGFGNGAAARNVETVPGHNTEETRDVDEAGRRAANTTIESGTEDVVTAKGSTMQTNNGSDNDTGSEANEELYEIQHAEGAPETGQEGPRATEGCMVCTRCKNTLSDGTQTIKNQADNIICCSCLSENTPAGQTDGS